MLTGKDEQSCGVLAPDACCKDTNADLYFSFRTQQNIDQVVDQSNSTNARSLAKMFGRSLSMMDASDCN